MSRCSIAVLAAAAIITSTTAAAKSPAPATPVSPEVQQQIDIVAKRLCKAEPVVGTRLAVKRKCDTPAQLVAYQRQAREIMEEYRQRPCMMGTGAGPNDTPMQC